MGKSKKKTSVNLIASLNIISTFILQGIVFFTTPIFTRLLGNTQYGTYSLFNSWVLILTCIMGISMHASIGTGVYTFKDRYLSFRNSILLFSTLVCALELLIMFIFRNQFSQWTGFSAGLVMMIGFTALGHYIILFAQKAYIYEKKAWSNFILSVSVSVFTVILSIILILHSADETRYLGRIYGVAIPYVLIAVIAWIILFAQKPTSIKSEFYKYGIIVGSPIVFHSLSQNLLGQSDRVMMQFAGISNSEIGIYSLFYTLSAVLSTILNALNNSWGPFYYDDLSEKKWDRINDKCRNYIELFTVLTVGFILLSREVSYIMADSTYWSGISVIPILSVAVFFTFMYQFPVNFEFYYQKTGIIAVGTVGSAVVNIILNAVLIPPWGMYGAAAATAISYFMLFLAHFIIVKNMKEEDFHLKISAFVPALITVSIAIVLFYTLQSLPLIRWGIGAAAGAYELYRILKRKSIF